MQQAPRDDVRRELKRAEAGRVATRIGAISIECPVRRKLGELFDFEEMTHIAALARERGIRLHLDGARLHVAAAYSAVSVRSYAALFDTVYVSLWKCFNAPFGAVLAGSTELLDGVHHLRRMLGGSLPYAWPAALVAAHFRPGFLDRFSGAKESFERLLLELERGGRVTVERVASGTNYAKVSWEGAPEPAALREALTARGIELPEPARVVRGFVVGANETLLRRPPDAVAAEVHRAMDDLARA